MKKILVSIILVFIVWQGMDFVMHGLILRSSYESMPQLWRPMAEMKFGFADDRFSPFRRVVRLDLCQTRFTKKRLDRS